MNRRRFVKGSFALLGSLPAPSAQRTIMIDSHVHVWKHSPEFPFAPEAKVPEFDLSAEDLLSLMSAIGVARTVLIQVIHYRWDNRYLLDVLHHYPGKFHGVCRVNPEDPRAPDHLSERRTPLHPASVSSARGPPLRATGFADR